MPNPSIPDQLSTPHRKRPKWLKWVLIFVFAAALGGLLFWLYYRKQIVREQLEMAVWNGTSGLYRISYAEMRLDEWSGNIRFTHLNMDFDSARYQQLLAEGKAPAFLVRIKIPELEINGVETPRALLSQELQARELEIIRPDVEWIVANQADSARRNVPSSRELADILGDLDWLEIDHVKLSDARFRKSDWGDRENALSVDGLTLRLDSVAVDSITVQDPDRLLFARFLDLQLEHASWKTDNGEYQLEADSVRLDSRARRLQLGKFTLTPQQSEEAFTRSLRYASDQFRLTAAGVEAFGLELPKLLRDTLVADSMVLDNGSFRVYRDLIVPHDGKNRVGTYPHQMIRDAPVSLHIPLLSGNNWLIEYRERNADTRQVGAIRFENTRFDLRDISNQADTKGVLPTLHLKAQTQFLGVSPLYVDWSMFTNDPNGRFLVKASLGSIGKSSINSLIVPLGPARLEEGKVNSLDFTFTGTDYNMVGDLLVKYDDIKLSLLKTDDEGKLKKKGLASMAANWFLKSSNPSRSGDEPRTAEVIHQRVTDRSIFHFLWKSIFAGIEKTVK